PGFCRAGAIRLPVFCVAQFAGQERSTVAACPVRPDTLDAVLGGEHPDIAGYSSNRAGDGDPYAAGGAGFYRDHSVVGERDCTVKRWLFVPLSRAACSRRSRSPMSKASTAMVTPPDAANSR